MSWIALVGPELEENLALRYLSSSLERAGLRAEIIPFDRRADLARVIEDIVGRDDPPMLVGIQLAFQWRAIEMMSLAMGLRERGYAGHITTGGHFATFSAQELLRDFPELDTVCRHESEQTLVELVEALRDGGSLTAIPGLAVREAGEPRLTPMRRPPDLESLPPPARPGLPRRCFGHALAPLVGSRGCYARCSFCCIAAWHEQVLPGKRYRLRPAEQVADEMVALKRERGVEIFIFHDDNFFVPSHKRNLERINALADALEEREIGDFAVVVKARPNDVDPEVFATLQRRLHALRTYVGIETDSDQGLVTLSRRLDSRQNHAAIDTLRELGMFGCFNLLIYDPDTTVASIETNVDFMEHAADFPFNFCRTELYAGTPLLERLIAEKRVKGDYFFYDYSLRDAQVERIFRMSIDAFWPRNFGGGALHNEMGGWRLQLETCWHFHPSAWRPAWREEMIGLHRRVGLDTVAGLREIIAHVRQRSPGTDADLVRELSPRLRVVEQDVRKRWLDLHGRMVGAVKADTRTAGWDMTPLQHAVPEVSFVG
ncbi:MAG: cobalamin B12-binding domain-containing protein [Myxococcales bacterium]|nr:cobalamin-dependent protein [Myxococcales bacterium]MCB9717251.1 cobalamin B12-binding domain-containing protein [Myxococcales bacterium]